MNAKVLTLSRQPLSNSEDHTQPQQSIMSDRIEVREAVPSRFDGSVLTETVGRSHVLDSIRSVGSTDERNKIHKPYSSILEGAGEMQVRARSFPSEVFESSAALPGRSTGLEVREKPDYTYSHILEHVKEKQTHTIMNESSAALSGYSTGRKDREKPEKEYSSFYVSDIGITFLALDGRHVVASILPNAPQSVLKNVCKWDELLSVDGKDVTRTSPDGVAALLKASSICIFLFVFVQFLFHNSNADSNIELKLNRNATCVRFV
jgi:hypothetical protein